MFVNAQNTRVCLKCAFVCVFLLKRKPISNVAQVSSVTITMLEEAMTSPSSLPESTCSVGKQVMCFM